MSKYSIVLLILASTAFPSLYFCSKNFSYFAQLEENSAVVSAYEQFASKVESGELSNQEIAKRLRILAKIEKNTSTGYGLLKLGNCGWAVAFIFITVFQGLMLRKLLKVE